VVEHLYRWTNWDITEKSDPFLKTNAQEIEFRIPLKPDEVAHRHLHGPLFLVRRQPAPEIELVHGRLWQVGANSVREPLSG
jgi:hypothetical protein